MSRKPTKAGTRKRFECPECKKRMWRHVSYGTQYVVSWCEVKNKTVLLALVKT
jgi:hypothetical protein